MKIYCLKCSSYKSIIGKAVPTPSHYCIVMNMFDAKFEVKMKILYIYQMNWPQEHFIKWPLTSWGQTYHLSIFQLRSLSDYRSYYYFSNKYYIPELTFFAGWVSGKKKCVWRVNEIIFPTITKLIVSKCTFPLPIFILPFI